MRASHPGKNFPPGAPLVERGGATYNTQPEAKVAWDPFPSHAFLLTRGGKRLKTRLFILCALGAALQAAALRAEASHIFAVPHPPPVERFQAQVFAAIEAEDWAAAYALASRGNDPLLSKIVAWIDYTRLETRARFGKITAFIVQNPDWPDQRLLERNAEEALADSIPDGEVLAWFSRYEPRTVKGRMHLARALLATGKREQATALLRETWVNGDFPRRQERDFLRRYRKFLRKEDHVQRLDRLLWDGRSWEARRMLRRVAAGRRALAVARIRLRRFRGGVDSAIRRVPGELIDDPGLVYERLRWRRRKGRDEDARALLENPPQNLVRPGAWWTERGILVRRALRKDESSLAYRLAKDHGQTSGATFAEAEWLAGWIALRFLEDSEDALNHFTALYENVRFPISLARGAYWAGRAAEASGDNELAQEWYAKAARHFTTFYGQLAATRLDGKALPVVPQDPLPDAQEAEAFENNELVKAARLLRLSADREHLGRFILHLNKKARTPAEHALTASLAASQNRPDLALAAAKRSARRGVQLLGAAYPAYPLPRDRNGLEAELLLALLRQESAFDIDAISDAGARGLMQLLPSTARIVARRLKLGYATRKLTADPEYNMKLGIAYLASLLDAFAGSYVLALAAYNGGPTRVRKWLRANGDPRQRDVDVIDWIELIPFDETRDYVQRVLENLQVYRLRNGRSNPGVTLDRDLNR